ncbi:hypothetical protein [Kribbella sp. NPDC051770]|uniref:hypothetical protein n=1 Tax=Kribbella sp. NPDC051770 TaxID=3155413 RepID=UPI003449D04A
MTMFEAPQVSVDQPAAPYAAVYAVLDGPRRRWLRLRRRWVAEVAVGAAALALAVAAFVAAHRF